MKKILLLIMLIALFLDAGLLINLLENETKPGALNDFFILHFLLSAFIAAAVFFSTTSQRKSWGFFFLFFCTSAFIPGFGFLLLILTYLFWQFIPTQLNELRYQAIEAHDISIDEHRLHGQYGSGGAIRRIFNENMADNLRTNAILTVSSAANQFSNKILLDSIQSKSNPVRLLSYSIINSQENALTKQITDLHTTLKNTRGRQKRGRVLKYLGETYWELSYKGLIEGKQKEFMLEAALNYFEEAEKILTRDGELAYYLGRIHLIQHHYDSAKTFLKKAIQLYFNRDIVIPYLAEIHYQEGDYLATRQLMMSDKDLAYIPRLVPIVNMWRSQNAS